jgi:hypothetical protein
LRPYLSPNTRIHSNWNLLHLNVNNKITKAPREHIKEFFYNFKVGKFFLTMTQKPTSYEIDKFI